MILPLQASPASSILDVPSVALLVLAVVALAFASVAQSVEQAVQRLTLAGVEDLIEEERRNARVLYGLVDHRQRTLLSLRAFRTFWQVVFAVMGTITNTAMRATAHHGRRVSTRMIVPMTAKTTCQKVRKARSDSRVRWR